MAFGTKKWKCFQILGFDVLVDKNMKAWLLEINAHPSLNINYEVNMPDGGFISKLSTVDLFIKEQVVIDAIALGILPIEKQILIPKGETFRSYKLILAEDMENSTEFQTICTKLFQIFSHLSGCKFTGTLTSGQFVKLGNLSGMTNGDLTKVGYDLLFKQILINYSDTTHMDFYTFIDAIERIAKLLKPEYTEENKVIYIQEITEMICDELDF